MSNLGMVAKVRVGLFLLAALLFSSTAWATSGANEGWNGLIDLHEGELLLSSPSASGAIYLDPLSSSSEEPKSLASNSLLSSSSAALNLNLPPDVQSALDPELPPDVQSALDPELPPELFPAATPNGSASLAPIIYLDENGDSQSCTEYTLLTNNTNVSGELPGGWYVVDGKVSYTSTLKFNGDVNLILADNAELSVVIVNDIIFVS